ncbi:MAG TPA: hypothetical protein VF404_10995 [Sphingomonas sp.]
MIVETERGPGGDGIEIERRPAQQCFANQPTIGNVTMADRARIDRRLKPGSGGLVKADVNDWRSDRLRLLVSAVPNQSAFS